MTDIYTYVCNIADEIGHDQTKRMDCPECGGKNTFTVTNSMGRRLWNCYKASCNISGTAKVNMTVDQIKKAKTVKKQLNTFVLPDCIVPLNSTNIMNNMDSIYKEHCMYDVRENRAVFLIKNEDGTVVDAVGRSLTKRLPKWKRYGDSRYPYVCRTSHCDAKLQYTCVLVEDCISACAVTKLGVTGVALLGTSLLEEHKQFMSKNFTSVVVALDPDALPKNLQIAKELRSWVAGVKVLRLTDDLKYNNNADIEKLGELIWN